MQHKSFNGHVHGLRGLATLAVVFQHVYSGSSTAGFYPDGWPVALGWLFESFRHSVEMFFMISGYLITDALVRKGSVGGFMLDRLIRIWPAYLAVLLPLFAIGALTKVTGLFETEPPSTWLWHLLLNIFFIPGVFDTPIILGVAWTLSWEMVFYLTAALAFIVVRRGHPWLAALICAALTVLLFERYPGIVFLSVGVSLSLFRDTALRRLREFHAPVLSLVVFLSSWTWFMTHHWFGQQPWDLWSVLGLVTALVAGTLFFDAVIGEVRVFRFALLSRPAQFLGKVSFSLYLWHTVVMFATKRVCLKFVVPQYGDVAGLLAFALLSVPLALLIAYVSYELFERRAGRWLHRLFAQSQARQPAKA